MTSSFDISCQRLVDMAALALDGLLDPELREVYEQHLVFCSECRVFLGRQRVVRDLLAELPGGPSVASPSLRGD